LVGFSSHRVCEVHVLFIFFDAALSEEAALPVNEGVRIVRVGNVVLQVVKGGSVLISVTVSVFIVVVSRWYVRAGHGSVVGILTIVVFI
jgi:hypothetical protein